MDLLSRNLDPRRHYGYLRSAAVLNSEDQETIDSQTTKRQRAIAMVDILRTKGPRAFDALCGSLEQDKTQMFLLSALNKALEREIGILLVFNRRFAGKSGNWTTRGYANSRIANSRTGQVADWTTRGLADAAKKEN